MTNIDPNLRKAAVLLRSLDADTAAMMLGQLSPDEAAAIRGAMRALGPIESDDQADVVAELRRERPAATTANSGDVELALSSSFDRDTYDQTGPLRTEAGRSKRFEFLQGAPIDALVPYLAREHAQTIAVVLSYLAPERAAAVLAALPQKVQAETIDRLSVLGETDPETVGVLERELAAWLNNRETSRANSRSRRDTMATILAAADAQSRSRILGNMKNQNATLADRIAPPKPAPIPAAPKVVKTETRGVDILSAKESPLRQTRMSAPRIEERLPHVAFDDLIHLDSHALAAVLRQADPNVLTLALAGSHDELVDRICAEMPKRTARTFRRELRRLGPTRLSDVEAAQRAVAQIAARQMARKQVALSGADF